MVASYTIAGPDMVLAPDFLGTFPKKFHLKLISPSAKSKIFDS